MGWWFGFGLRVGWLVVVLDASCYVDLLNSVGHVRWTFVVFKLLFSCLIWFDLRCSGCLLFVGYLV